MLDLLAFFAQALDLDRDEGRPELVVMADVAQALIQIGIPEFDDLAGGHADHVVVSTARLHLLVEVVLSAQAALADQAALHQEVEGSIDRCTGDLALFDFHPGQEIVSIQVVTRSKDLIQQGEPFLGHLEVVFPQVLDE